MLLRLTTAALALSGAAVAYYVLNLIEKRKALRGLPGPPMLNNLLGHLHIADECSKKLPSNVHAHCYGDYIRNKYNLPDMFYVDWRPIGPLFLFIADPEVASQYVTTGQSLLKSPYEHTYMETLLGKSNLVTVEGAHWKALRSVLNPGFSAGNLMTLSDYIVDAALVFSNVLRDMAQKNELFELEEAAAKLTTDIIAKVTLGADLNCQDNTKRLHPIARLFRERVTMMRDMGAIFPWQDVSLTRPFRIWWNRIQLDRAINLALDDGIQLRTRDAKTGKARNRRTVIDLALSMHEKETSTEITSITQLPDNFRQDLVDSIKTCYFAGEDTSASTISYVFYLLHRYPASWARLQAELDAHFPPGSEATAAALKADPYVANKLTYLNAVIKETLRIFPPGSTVRAIDPASPPPQTSIVDPHTGARLPLTIPELNIYPAAHMIQRNERFFPQPRRFIPERFLQDETPFPDTELFTPAGRDAWRPFEKGPRACIGQELAMIELRIALAITVREFDFVLEYPGEGPDQAVECKDYADGTSPTRVEGHRCYQILKGSAKPLGGMSGRMYERDA